ncbi:hypothetical protein FSC37_11905 [Piscinibacter aquaticus]|uniref:Tetratricopeptide repeat protein n=1 Tax=Piscinibacter aquaticus TaxID=392597 RepID=A0A5C6U3L8_9BURK|nr:hypothetical protein FSC37_11905 [Piscinibacter aquaticus]
MPNLLRRNERAIAEAAATAERARLLAQRVTLLARHWHTDELPQALRAAEAAVRSANDARAQAELELARGVAAYYGADVDAAAAPVERALETALALGDPGLQAECEARLGCIHGTLQREPAQVLGHLKRAVTLGQPHRPLAAARALYVVATLYQEAELMDQSVRHYRRATLIARRENDEQLLAALHRYMTLAQVQQVRRARAAGRLDEEQVKQSLAGLGSAQQLSSVLSGEDERAVQAAPRRDAAPGRRARTRRRGAGCGGRPRRTRRPHLGGHHRARRPRRLPAHCGRLLDAHRIGALAESELEPGYADYARAVVHDSLAELAALIGRSDRQARHAELARAAWENDRRYCGRLRDALLAQGPLAD